jgi:CheY-like chemotaxis protein
MQEHLIFVVDDEDIIRTALSRSLRMPGWRVVAFESGTDALARLGSERPALIIADRLMPGMSGLALLRRVRSEYRAVRTVLLTGGIPDDEIQAGIDGGVVEAMLEKPWDQTTLLRTVSDLLNGPLPRTS